MLPFYSVFFVALLCFFFSKNGKSTSLMFVCFLYTALFVGLGDMIGGYDRYIYGEVFDRIADEIRGEGNVDRLRRFVNGSEYGYFAWQIIVAQITANRYVFIFLTTIAMYVLYVYCFKLYLKNYQLAFLIFIGFFYYFTMTYLRQVIAVGIVWLGVRYIWERKFIKFISFVLLGATFHSSALIMLIMYFIPIRKYSKSKVLMFLFACLIIGLLPFAQIVMPFVGDVLSQEERLSGYAMEEQGFRIEYVLEVMFCVWVSFVNYEKIGGSAKTLVFQNMLFAFCAVLLVFMRFGQGGRLGWFFFVSLLYLFPLYCEEAKTAKWLKPLVILVCFLLFARVTTSWGPMHAPYKTFLTNGRPSGFIYDTFEYDENYTINKMYR